MTDWATGRNTPSKRMSYPRLCPLAIRAIRTEAQIAPGSSTEHRHDESSSAAHDASVAPPTESVSHQIAGLRRDLDKWQARMRLQDILGGVGYILGITGMLFYFLGVRRKRDVIRSSPSKVLLQDYVQCLFPYGFPGSP